MTDIGKLTVNIGDLPAGVFSATPLARDFVLHSQNGQEIMRLDKEGMVFMGERITDAGEAYVAWMKTMVIMQGRTAEDDDVPVGYISSIGDFRLREITGYAPLYRRPQPKARLTDEDMQKAAQTAERERIKSRVKEAAENLWCIRNEVVEEVDGELKRVPYSLYIGPSLNTMEEFVNRLLEET